MSWLVLGYKHKTCLRSCSDLWSLVNKKKNYRKISRDHSDEKENLEISLLLVGLAALIGETSHLMSLSPLMQGEFGTT